MRRTIIFRSLADQTDAQVVEALIGALPGISKVRAEWRKHRLVVNYDPRRIRYLMILDTLLGAGFSLPDNGWSRIKGHWYEFIDCNARDNANAPPPVCCNKPPK